MRRTRWLLLLAILAILGGIGITYRSQRQVLQKQAPAKPPMLPTQISGVREGFKLTRTEAGQNKWEITAARVRQEKDSSRHTWNKSRSKSTTRLATSTIW
jgi:hypothetical protein